MKSETALVFNDTSVPAKVFSKCQQCESDDVFSFDGDLFCNPCGWNSIEQRVESQLSAQIAKHNKKQKKRTPRVSVESKEVKAVEPSFEALIVAAVA